MSQKLSIPEVIMATWEDALMSKEHIAYFAEGIHDRSRQHEAQAAICAMTEGADVEYASQMLTAKAFALQAKELRLQ